MGMNEREPREVRLAREVLENKIFRQTVKKVSESYFQQWVASTKVEEREEIYARMNVLKDVIQELEAEINIYTGDGDA